MVNAAVLFKIIELHFFILMSYKIASSNCQYFYPPPPSQYDYYDPYYEPYQEAAHPTQSYHYGLPRSPYSDANRREENVAGGWNFQPQEVMSEAQKAAIMTRGMADLIDTKGNDFLSLLGDYTSTGIKYHFCEIGTYLSNTNVNFPPFAESKLDLRDISKYVRKAADFMESSAATAVKFSQEFDE